MSNGEAKTYILTLCLIYRDEKILLGMKKRGFGAGRWNGFGGKVKPSELYDAAAIREVHEEARILPLDLQKRGELIFQIEKDDATHHVHLYSASLFEGSPRETEEMSPQWFSFDEIPYKSMWSDDKFWLPLILAGKNILGKFTFSDSNTLTHHQINEL